MYVLFKLSSLLSNESGNRDSQLATVAYRGKWNTIFSVWIGTVFVEYSWVGFRKKKLETDFAMNSPLTNWNSIDFWAADKRNPLKEQYCCRSALVMHDCVGIVLQIVVL